MERDDGEDYVDTRSKSRNKNLFDDDVPFEAIKRSIATYGDDNFEDEAEFLDLESSSSSVRYGTGSSKTMPDLSSLATPVSSSIPTPAAFRTAVSMQEPTHSFGSFQKIAQPAPHSQTLVGHARSHSLTIGRQKTGGDLSFPKVNMLQTPSSSSNSLTIEEAVGAKRVGSLDTEQMQQEIHKLNRKLMTARKEQFTKLPIDLTLRRILKGESYTFAFYKSLEDKLALLDQTVMLLDGNAITAAVLHLKHTVKASIFQQELQLRPVAANHYLAYLRGRFEHAELIHTLTMLGRTEEAAIVKYQQTCREDATSGRVSMLQTCLRVHFQSDPALATDALLVQEHIDLLERQRPIEDSDTKQEAEGRNPIFLEFPRRVSLISMPVTTTLFYCCLYHFHLPENNLASPLAIKQRHQLPEKQFVWTAVSARAKVKAWKDIEQLLTGKGWFGGKKMKAAIGFDKVVEILHKFQAPKEELKNYLLLVDDLDTRLILSQKVRCDNVTLETLQKQKDRRGLEDFVRIHGNSIIGNYALKILKEEAVKWK